MIVGPHRVFPGRLSVSRTIGDIEAKHPKYGGNPRVVIPTPDIKSFKIRNNYDFIILACDGVFEKLSNQEAVKNAWATKNSNTLHERCGEAVDRVLQFSAFKRTFDNITSVMIAFENFENIPSSHKQLEQANNPIIGNPFALITEFSIQYEGVQMNGPNEEMGIVEEELVEDDHEVKPPPSQ